MTAPKDRVKKKKFTRTPGSKTKVHYFKGKPGKHHCALCSKVLHGMPHNKTKAELSKLSKTKKRPEALLAGQVCSQCRTLLLDEAIKIKLKTKSLDDVKLNFKPYVESLVKMVE
jgi:ribosomal protein L34E